MTLCPQCSRQGRCQQEATGRSVQKCRDFNEKECANCAHGGASMSDDPCAACMKETMHLTNELYPRWEPQEVSE